MRYFFGAALSGVGFFAVGRLASRVLLQHLLNLQLIFGIERFLAAARRGEWEAHLLCEFGMA